MYINSHGGDANPQLISDGHVGRFGYDIDTGTWSMWTTENSKSAGQNVGTTNWKEIVSASSTFNVGIELRTDFICNLAGDSCVDVDILASSTGSSIMPGWPDALRCNQIGGAGESLGEYILYPNYAFAEHEDFGNFAEDFVAYYTPGSGGQDAYGSYIFATFKPDQTAYKNNYSYFGHDCDGKSIAELIASGQAIYFGEGDVNVSGSSLPTCANGQTVIYDSGAAEWQCADSAGGGEVPVHFRVTNDTWVIGTWMDFSGAVEENDGAGWQPLGLGNPYSYTYFEAPRDDVYLLTMSAYANDCSSAHLAGLRILQGGTTLGEVQASHQLAGGTQQPLSLTTTKKLSAGDMVKFQGNAQGCDSLQDIVVSGHSL